MADGAASEGDKERRRYERDVLCAALCCCWPSWLPLHVTDAFVAYSLVLHWLPISAYYCLIPLAVRRTILTAFIFDPVANLHAV